MPVIQKTEWKSTADSDGLWVQIDMHTLDARIIPIYSEGRHDTGKATSWGEEHHEHPSYMYAKFAEFPNEERKMFRGQRE